MLVGLVASLLGVLALGFGGYRVARVGFGLPKGTPAIFGGVVLAWTWMTLGTLGLGLAGWLTRSPLLAWSVAGPLLSLWLGRTTADGWPEKIPPSGSDWGVAVAIAFGLSIWAVLSLLVPSLIFPVKVISDGPIYHLYFAARWWQVGRIF